MSARTLLVISGGREAVPGIERARALGLRVVVFDGDRQAPGAALAHDSRVVSTYDAEGAARAAREYERTNGRIDGVIAIAADVPHTIARVAEELGLRASSSRTAALSMDKLAQKRRLAEAGVPVPWFAPVACAGELEHLARQRGGALVVKPVDSRGARGVTLLREPSRSALSYRAALAHSPSGRVMAEEFLEGPQVSSETLFVRGVPHTVGFSDRNYARLEQFAPWIIEDGGTQPSELGARERRELVDVAEAAGQALGITDGPCKGDLVWTARGARVIEVAARLSGGWFCTDQIPLATGVDLVGAAVRQAMGEDPAPRELAPRELRAVAIRYLFPRPGEIVAMDAPDALRAQPGIHRFELFLGPGDEVRGITDHTARAGCVIAHAASRAEAVALAERAAREFQVETRPRTAGRPAA